VKKKITKPSKAQSESSKPSSKGVTEKENKFDFGGLPQRDLKKNLGC